MGIVKKVIRSGLAAKAAQILIREAQKPENQRRARELVRKLQDQRRKRA